MDTAQNSSDIQVIDASRLSTFECCDLYGHRQYIVRGTVPIGTEFRSDAPIQFESPLPDHTVVEASGDVTLREATGSFVKITAEKITGDATIGSYCYLQASATIHLRGMGEGNTLSAKGKIDIREEGGHKNTLLSNHHINIYTLGDDCYLSGGSVSGYHVGARCNVTAKNDRIGIASTGDNCTFTAAAGCNIPYVGENATFHKISPRRSEHVQAKRRGAQVNTAMGCGIHKSRNHYYLTEETSDHSSLKGRVALVDRLRDLGVEFKNTTPEQSGIPGAVCELTLPYHTMGNSRRIEAQRSIQHFIDYFAQKQR